MPILGGGVDSERVAKWFVLAAVFNALMAIVFLAPFLIPAPGGTSDLFSLSFAIANFPGTWMLIAWIVFIIVGVLGMAGWGFIYYLHSKLWGRQGASKLFSLGHLGLSLAGVYVATIFLFIAGFIGGRATLPPTGCFVLVEQNVSYLISAEECVLRTRRPASGMVWPKSCQRSATNSG